MSSIAKRLEPDIERIVEDLGYYYVATLFVHENGNNVLRILIDKKTGLGLDDCEKVSGEISDWLDEVDPIKSSYLLEISSPGLDRPLKTDRELRTALDKEVDISLYAPIEGKKKYRGILTQYDDAKISIVEGEKSIELDRSKISKITKVIEIGG
ncbi:MAG: ribosome maturation factor RimP [Tissierellia bacterium]|nr:ribosome maturation factor RimP [Tissierellia bacterium]